MNNILQLEYALAKQVPDMERGFLIVTNYGDIKITSYDAKRFKTLTEKIIKAQIAALQKKQGGAVK